MKRISSPIIVALIFASGMALFGAGVGFRLLYYPAWFLISGKLFESRPVITGGALDQPSLHKYLFIFAVCATWSGLVVLTARVLTNPRRRSALLTFRICAMLVYVTPLAGLTCTLYEVIRYMATMGFTPRRLIAAVVCVVGYFAVAVFLHWACRFRLPWRPNQTLHWTGATTVLGT